MKNIMHQAFTFVQSPLSKNRRNGQCDPSASLISSLASRLFSLNGSKQKDGTACGNNSAVVLRADLVLSKSSSQTPRVDDPHLHQVPKGIHLTYRPTSLFMQLVVWLTAGLLVTWLQLARTIHVESWQSSSSGILHLSWQIFCLAVVLNLALKEILQSPSRVSIQELLDNHCLPSPLSRYERLHCPSTTNAEATSLGVHYLECQTTQKEMSLTAIAAQPVLYCNHGCGASSLTWTPVLQKLVHQLQCRVGLAHDSVGFGFTERHSDTSMYTYESSSRIGRELLRQNLQKRNEQNDKSSPVILMGHSMGALVTLHMAANMSTTDPDVPKHVILVAPAIVLWDTFSQAATFVQPVVHWIQRSSLLCWMLQFFLVLPLMLVMRIVYSIQGSWKAQLEMYRSPARRSETPILRYSWPSLMQGWEYGVLKFFMAQTELVPKKGCSFPSSSSCMNTNSHALIQQVLAQPNTVVTVILFEKDVLVPLESVQNFFQPYQDQEGRRVQQIVLPGLGHAGHEEDPDQFVRTIVECVQSSSTQSTL